MHQQVLFEGKKVAVKGSYYMSMGDIASKGTGGGIVSAATHGKAEFVAPGSMDVKAEGKNVQLLGDAMTNNGSNPSNAGTLPGNVQATDAFKTLVGDDDTALALCKAACKAIAEKKKKKNKTKKFQNLLRSFLDPKGSNGLRGAGRGLSAGLSSRVLTEVAMQVGKAGAFIGKWGAAVGTGAAFVKWDIVLVDPNAAVLGGLTTIAAASVIKIIEVKFPGDSLTDNQQAALDKMTDADKEKYAEMHVESACVCA